MSQIHRHTATPDSVPVNAYLVEGSEGVVAVDATLTVSGGRGLRADSRRSASRSPAVLVRTPTPTTTAGSSSWSAATDVPICAVARRRP